MVATTNASIVPPYYDLLIIGAGIAGLAAGRMAQRVGYSVMLIDKGRRVGGRVSTRRSDGFVFNYGAQYITARTDEFNEALAAATSAGMAGYWKLDPAKNVVIGTPMMRAIPSFLAEGLTIQQNRRIAHISRQADHILCVTQFESGEFFPSQACNTSRMVGYGIDRRWRQADVFDAD